VLVSTTPVSGPIAGKRFTVTPDGLKLPASGEPALLMPRPDSYSCRATLAALRLAGHGKGSCTWAIPKSARKKMLAVVVTVQYEGATKTVSLSFRIS
jgi:hypothetical protein